jgi:hypothetical protein
MVGDVCNSILPVNCNVPLSLIFLKFNKCAGETPTQFIPDKFNESPVCAELTQS